MECNVFYFPILYLVNDHQLIELYNKILLALNNRQITSITFADISKAFDTVWIKALLYKLKKNTV